MKSQRYNIYLRMSVILCIITICSSIQTILQAKQDNIFINQNLRLLIQDNQLANTKQVVQSHQHNIQKIIWLYQSSNNKQQLIQRFENLNILNIHHFAQKQNYTVNKINQLNFRNYLSQQQTDQIISLINSLKQKLPKKYQSIKSNPKSSHQHQSLLQNIIQRLIIYSLLDENGGVFIDNSVTLIEPLDKLFSQIKNRQQINGGTKIYQGINSYCFAFYNQSYSSQTININNQTNKWKFKPNIVIYPNIQDYFIACSKNNNFMKKLTYTYVNILTQGVSWSNIKNINTNQQLVGLTNHKLIYQHGHLIASHFILQKQQQSLNQISPSSLAIRNLGLITLNSHLGPTKIKTQFSLDDYKIYQYLSKLTISQLQISLGKLKFVYRFNQGVQEIIAKNISNQQNQKQFWVNNSFAHKYWIQHIQKVKDQTLFKQIWQYVSNFNIIKNKKLQSHQDKNKNSSVFYFSQIQSPQVRKITFNQIKPKWQSLNKNVWIIWDNGIQGKSNLIVQLCYQNLKRSAQKSGFEIHPVSRNKIKQYLSSQILEKIDKTLVNASYDLSRQAISDIWRMALIYQHGGVYFDASTFSMDDSLDWLVKIPQIQQNLVWNRYNQQPQIFMLWNAYYGCPLEWKIDQKLKIKTQWHLSYQNNFIAAVKGNKLIEQWLDTMLQWITLPYAETQKLIQNVGILQHKWTWDSTWHFETGRYLTAMDSLKYVIGRRELLLKNQLKQNDDKIYQNAADYYGLWSMPGQLLGQQKLRGQTNYQHLDNRLTSYQKSYNTIYKYQYPFSYIQNILGPVSFQAKFFSRQLTFMNKFIYQFYLQNKQNFSIKKLHELIHPESVLATRLFDLNADKTIQLIEYYSKSAQMQKNIKAFSKIWVY